jgi:hypothetical protein
MPVATTRAILDPNWPGWFVPRRSGRRDSEFLAAVSFLVRQLPIEMDRRCEHAVGNSRDRHGSGQFPHLTPESRSG